MPSGSSWETVWAMAKAVKLHQIASGLFYKQPEIESPMNIEILDTQKIQWIRYSVPVLLREKGPVIVWCMYPRLLYLIQLVLNDQNIKEMTKEFYLKYKDDTELIIRESISLKYLIGVAFNNQESLDKYEEFLISKNIIACLEDHCF